LRRAGFGATPASDAPASIVADGVSRFVTVEGAPAGFGVRFDRARVYAGCISAHCAHIRDIHLGVEALDPDVGIAGIPETGQLLSLDCQRPVVRRTDGFTSPAPGAFAIIDKNHLKDRISRIGPCRRMDSKLAEQDNRASPYSDTFYEFSSGKVCPFTRTVSFSFLPIDSHRFSSMVKEVRISPLGNSFLKKNVHPALRISYSNPCNGR
jgi:hypothetical protein